MQVIDIVIHKYEQGSHGAEVFQEYEKGLQALLGAYKASSPGEHFKIAEQDSSRLEQVYRTPALRCAVLRCAVLCCAVLCCAVLCCVVLCCVVLCCVVLCCVVLCFVMLRCAGLGCAVLCCAVTCDKDPISICFAV